MVLRQINNKEMYSTILILDLDPSGNSTFYFMGCSNEYGYIREDIALLDKEMKYVNDFIMEIEL